MKWNQMEICGMRSDKTRDTLSRGIRGGYHLLGTHGVEDGSTSIDFDASHHKHSIVLFEEKRSDLLLGIRDKQSNRTMTRHTYHSSQITATQERNSHILDFRHQVASRAGTTVTEARPTARATAGLELFGSNSAKSKRSIVEYLIVHLRRRHLCPFLLWPVHCSFWR